VIKSAAATIEQMNTVAMPAFLYLTAFRGSLAIISAMVLLLNPNIPPSWRKGSRATGRAWSVENMSASSKVRQRGSKKLLMRYEWKISGSRARGNYYEPFRFLMLNQEVSFLNNIHVSLFLCAELGREVLCAVIGRKEPAQAAKCDSIRQQHQILYNQWNPNN